MWSSYSEVKSIDILISPDLNPAEIDETTETAPDPNVQMPSPNPPDFYNELFLDGQKYYSAVQASDSLPGGYVFLREIIETEAVGTELAGCRLYVEKGIVLPEHPKGLVYRNMGTMENHIWSTIARRMKHNHTCWSIRGGNNLAKILAKKCSGRLNDVTEKLKARGFETVKAERIKAEVLSAASAPRKDGKGYRYPVEGHIVRLDNCSGTTRRMFLNIIKN